MNQYIQIVYQWSSTAKTVCDVRQKFSLPERDGDWSKKQSQNAKYYHGHFSYCRESQPMGNHSEKKRKNIDGVSLPLSKLNLIRVDCRVTLGFNEGFSRNKKLFALREK